MLYTIMPDEIIAGNDQEKETGLTMQVIQIKNTRMIAYKNKSGEYTIDRLLSTCPSDYLKCDFQPGRVWKN